MLNNKKIISIPLQFSTPAGVPVCRQPFSLAVPFPVGAVEKSEQFSVTALTGKASNSSFQPISLWSDGSVKWGLVKSRVEVSDGCYAKLQLENTSSVESPEAALLRMSESSEVIEVHDGGTRYEFQKAGQQIFPDVFTDGNRIWHGSEIFLEVSDKNRNLEFAKNTCTIESSNTASVKINVCGSIGVLPDKRIDVTFLFEIIGGSWLSVSVAVHNPHRARHPDGIWDLGDSGSIKFNEFTLRFKKNDSDQISLRREPDSDWIELDGNSETTLFQASSGGANWDSPNHIDANGNNTNQFCGYRVTVDEVQLHRGERASPAVRVHQQSGASYSFSIRQYWQNFPKSLGFKNSAITLGLFPIEHGSDYELQGGERKKHTVVFSFSDENTALDWVDQPAVVTVSPDTVVESGVLRYTNGSVSDEYDRLFGESLSSVNGFFAKREIIDEYGWRNFGDIFADHETLYHESDELFISHYNNQYDPIYGFARQFLLTADGRWYQLMVDLARHVLDIDIYRTNEDRAEYNHGLLWHTDHYKKAHTCTHRTYSREHYAADCTGPKGGGPGSEHCYTSGLLLYYQLTGDPDAREAVLRLTSWIRHFYEGTGSLIEAAKRFLSEDLSDFSDVCKGNSVFRYRYGIDRGVGNYIRALLDSHELTADPQYVKEAENIIQSTFAANDELRQRNFDDIEGTWFYTIFLQEVIRYLDLKRSQGMLDPAFNLARNGLLHYARWMAAEESPYLNHPDRLEYPNDTWIAQDIRKANVLYAAYRYATTDREELLERARYFRDYVLKGLSESQTLHYSRIQIVMLQNHGPSGLMDKKAEPYEGLAGLPVREPIKLSCFYSVPGFLKSQLGELCRCLARFSIRREVSWVRARIG
ncbi:hypothetical protein AB833_20605 [Chromatiales bacterium (ex Bugula neritina AB1)]|nr:hypothetical protein AB833_20605 [Chromatiales bacterium (ex Bugula neritina AB1)]